MQAKEKLSREQIQAFLQASEDVVKFQGQNREEVYRWVNTALRQQDYEHLERGDKGLLHRYLEKMTGYSRAQITRLIGQYQSGSAVQLRGYRRNRFAARFTRADIELLVKTDEAHETMSGPVSGPATQKLLQRALHDFGDSQFQRLAGISVAHLYRLRASRTYRKQRIVFQPTRPTSVPIGERRRPNSQGRPGYLRVDTVHQGDREGEKGLYHINAVDEVTQWQVVGATAQISEAWLLPVLESMLEQFPFHIRGFHSDNGSEFINYTVAALLNKLLIEQTKSRPRRSNDNGLVESKNGSVIRKHIGYGHISSAHAEAFDQFYREHFNPYLNFHRPCGVPEIEVTKSGKTKRRYRWYATPWEILRQIPDLPRDLKEGVTMAELERRAGAVSDMEAAKEMQAAKRRLYASLPHRSTA